jgi:hypothetical protein
VRVRQDELKKYASEIIPETVSAFLAMGASWLGSEPMSNHIRLGNSGVSPLACHLGHLSNGCLKPLVR